MVLHRQLVKSLLRSTNNSYLMKYSKSTSSLKMFHFGDGTRDGEIHPEVFSLVIKVSPGLPMVSDT